MSSLVGTVDSAFALHDAAQAARGLRPLRSSSGRCAAARSLGLDAVAPSDFSLPEFHCALAPWTLGLRKSLPPANPGFSTVLYRPAVILPSLSLFVRYVREAGP